MQTCRNAYRLISTSVQFTPVCISVWECSSVCLSVWLAVPSGAEGGPQQPRRNPFTARSSGATDVVQLCLSATTSSTAARFNHSPSPAAGWQPRRPGTVRRGHRGLCPGTERVPTILGLGYAAPISALRIESHLP